MGTIRHATLTPAVTRVGAAEWDEGHVFDLAIADIAGLQAALDAKQAAGSYAPLAHTHDGSSLSIDDSAFSVIAGSTAQEAFASADSALLNALVVTDPAEQTRLVSGGQVVNEGNLLFRVSAASYYIGATAYTSAEQAITLTAADGTNPRIDVLYLDTAGVLGKITGTAAPTPSQPDVAPDQLYLTFVYVPAAATSLPGVTNENVYLENTEWTSSTSGTGFNANSTNNPASGTKCIEGTTVANNAYVQLQRGSAMTLDNYAMLVLKVRSKAAWASGRVLRVQWYSAGVAKGVPVTIASGYWGFDSSITSGYQQVAIPLSQFVVPAGTSINQLRITDAGGSIGFYIDNVLLQGQGTSVGTAGTDYLTQAQGDARYLQIASIGSITASGYTQTTGKLLGRSTASTGTIEEITVGSGLSLASGTLSATAGAITAKDEGVDLTTALTSVDFVGAGVTATNTGGAVTVTIPGGSYTDENAQDAIGAMVDGTLTYTDTTPLLGVNTTAEAERIRDVIGTALVAGSNVTITVNDAGDTITIAASSGGAAVSSQTGTSYTAVLGDANTYIQFSNASSITFTIPPNASVAFPVGTVIEMEQAGAGALTVAPGSGVTVNSRSSDLTLAGQYAVAFVKKVATDTWTMNGDL